MSADFAEPASDEAVDAIRLGYTFAEPAVELGVLSVDDVPIPDARIRIPLAMLNRHGLVCGATGTGKTITLQVLAEQIARAGVPVFAADIKGDLSGLATPGTPSEKLLGRTRKNGQQWSPSAPTVEFYALGGKVRIRCGPPFQLRADPLSKVLGLNDPESSSWSPLADRRAASSTSLTWSQC